MQLFAQKLKGLDRARLEAAIGPVLSAHRVHTAEISFQTERSGWVLRITVESLEDDGQSAAAAPEAATVERPPIALQGVNLELLAEISRDVSSALDVADLIPQHYNLEVSSPGLERPLRTARDFRASLGKSAKLHLLHPAPDGQSVLRGPILAVEEDAVRVDVDGHTRDVRLDAIERAHLIFELSAQPKGTRGKPNQHPKTDPSAERVRAHMRGQERHGNSSR
jgi:ribosome maturation factor RimP